MRLTYSCWGIACRCIALSRAPICPLCPPGSEMPLWCVTCQDASTALLLDGLALGPHFLKVRRPKDFKPLPGQGREADTHRRLVQEATVLHCSDPIFAIRSRLQRPAPTSLHKPDRFLLPFPFHLPLLCPAAPDAPGGGVPVIRGVVSTTVPDSEHKVYLGGIPTALNEMQVPHPHHRPSCREERCSHPTGAGIHREVRWTVRPTDRLVRTCLARGPVPPPSHSHGEVIRVSFSRLGGCVGAGAGERLRRAQGLQPRARRQHQHLQGTPAFRVHDVRTMKD